jgi:hypothetical protein
MEAAHELWVGKILKNYSNLFKVESKNSVGKIEERPRKALGQLTDRISETV